MARDRRSVGGWRVGAVTVAAIALVVPLAAAARLAPFVDATVHVQAGSLPPALDTLLALNNAPAPPADPAHAHDRGVHGRRRHRAGGHRIHDAAALQRRRDAAASRARDDRGANRRGRPGQRAARSSAGLGYGLDQNALVAVRQWRFRPGTRNGSPAEMTAEMDIEFNLRNEALNELIANDMATRIGSDVTAPRIIRTVNVAAADGAADRRTGTVALDIVLLEDGRPKIVRVLQSLSRSLDERAIDTFEQWRFTPAMKGGRPVKVRLQADITFR